MKSFLFLIVLVTANSFAGWITSESIGNLVPNNFLAYMVKPESRVASYPFITGDTFRAYSDFILDETNLDFDPSFVKSGDTIFLTSSYFILNEFFTYYHPLIKNKYIIITHNHDFDIPAHFAKFLDDPKIIAWFSKNIDRVHPKLFPLPIGIPNPVWTNDGYCNPDLFSNVIRNSPPLSQKINLVYVNISIHTNQRLRSEVFNYFRNKSFCFYASRKPSDQYLEEIKQYRFVLSPPGNGEDCFRTWEALLLGCIPIVKHSNIDRLFDDLPVILVHNWQEVTPELLEKKYSEFCQKKFCVEKLYIDYWLQQINKLKNENR